MKLPIYYVQHLLYFIVSFLITMILDKIFHLTNKLKHLTKSMLFYYAFVFSSSLLVLAILSGVFGVRKTSPYDGLFFGLFCYFLVHDSKQS